MKCVFYSFIFVFPPYTNQYTNQLQYLATALHVSIRDRFRAPCPALLFLLLFDDVLDEQIRADDEGEHGGADGQRAPDENVQGGLLVNIVPQLSHGEKSVLRHSLRSSEEGGGSSRGRDGGSLRLLLRLHDLLSPASDENGNDGDGNVSRIVSHRTVYGIESSIHRGLVQVFNPIQNG